MLSSSTHQQLSPFGFTHHTLNLMPHCSHVTGSVPARCTATSCDFQKCIALHKERYKDFYWKECIVFIEVYLCFLILVHDNGLKLQKFKRSY